MLATAILQRDSCVSVMSVGILIEPEATYRTTRLGASPEEKEWDYQRDAQQGPNRAHGRRERPCETTWAGRALWESPWDGRALWDNLTLRDLPSYNCLGVPKHKNMCRAMGHGAGNNE